MTNFFTPENEIYARYAAQALFLLSTLILIINEVRKHKFSKQDFLKNNTLPTASFLFLITATIFNIYISISGTVLFTTTAVIYFLLNRKFYPPPKIFYFIFLYTILPILGTIGTPKGFRFPDSTITFLVLPLSLCLIDIKQETLLKVAKIFTRVMIIYMVTCILYWLYNFQYLDIPLSEWLTQKSSSTIIPKGFENGDARLFVSYWSGNFHQTYISFVLFMGFISSAYLFYKQKIKNWEVLLYGILCVITVLLIESRIGMVVFPVLSIASLILYSMLRKKYFIPSLLSALIITSTIMLFMYDIGKNESIMKDTHRPTYYAIAIDYIQEHPYWGCGYHEQLATLDTIIARDSIPVKKHLNYVHNQFLGDTMQYGISGLIMLFILLCGILFYAIKWQSYPLLMLLLVLSFYMMIEEPLYAQGGITRVTAFLVFFVALTAKTNKNETKH
ncbi:MAG: O-antigen ligase family protein [Bacteroidales bacterium]|jgi:O-antigen ligase|nr:O-antigen ligase family protein [Bacteroidales bacterium]